MNDTYPSLAGYTTRSRIGPLRMPPPPRSVSGALTSEHSTDDMVEFIATAWADTSMCWPRPDWLRSISASVTAEAA